MTNHAKSEHVAELRIYKAPEHLRLQLKILALERHTTLNAIAIQALQEWLNLQRKKVGGRKETTPR